MLTISKVADRGLSGDARAEHIGYDVLKNACDRFGRFCERVLEKPRVVHGQDYPYVVHIGTRIISRQRLCD